MVRTTRGARCRYRALIFENRNEIGFWFASDRQYEVSEFDYAAAMVDEVDRLNEHRVLRQFHAEEPVFDQLLLDPRFRLTNSFDDLRDLRERHVERHGRRHLGGGFVMHW
jgi:hypothetical protein